MAGASLGLSHESSSYYYSPSSSSSCFPPLAAAAADSAAAAVAMSFAPADFDGSAGRSFDDYSVVPPLQAPPFAGGSEMTTTMSMYGSGWHANTGADDVDVAARGVMSRRSTTTTTSAAARIGFRTRSAVEVMDDGFKWRKYGKKAVKSSPNPRNYYRCSSDGCGVKKRVERDSDDPRYVLTTYDGVHNHPTPGAGGAPPPPPAASSSSPPSWTWSEPPQPEPTTAVDAWVAAQQSSESSY